MNQTIANVELTDGTILRARVGIHTKIAWEKAAKANKWNHEDNPFTVSLFWGWHATRHAGQHDDSYDEFTRRVADAQLKEVTTDTDEADEDPTRTAPGTESP